MESGLISSGWINILKEVLEHIRESQLSGFV
jgi:hypothetical protein